MPAKVSDAPARAEYRLETVSKGKVIASYIVSLPLSPRALLPESRPEAEREAATFGAALYPTALALSQTEAVWVCHDRTGAELLIRFRRT